jgi:hypothetical protein
LRLLDCRTIGTWRWQRQPYAQSTFTPQEILLVLVSVRGRAIFLSRRIISMKNSSDAIGNWAHDLPACSIVRQQTAPLRTPSKDCTGVWMFWNVVLWRQLSLIWGNVLVLLDVNLTSVVAQALRIDNIAIRTCLRLSFQGYLEILVCIINYDHAQGHGVSCIFELFHILYFI